MKVLTQEEVVQAISQLQARYTPSELAFKIGVSSSSIYNWVNRTSQPYSHHLRKIKQLAQSHKIFTTKNLEDISA